MNFVDDQIFCFYYLETLPIFATPISDVQPYASSSTHNWRAGASQPSRIYIGSDFSYISRYIYIINRKIVPVESLGWLTPKKGVLFKNALLES